MIFLREHNAPLFIFKRKITFYPHNTQFAYQQNH